MRQNHMSGNCDHSGFHSGMGKLSHEHRAIRFVLVCDGCGQEMREIHVEDYALAGGDASASQHPGTRAA
jgi:hypothetical protein